jgi:hypothetical protein
MKWLPAIALVSACASDYVPPPAPHDEWDDRLAERVVDYNAALRIAALRLTGELPTLAELERVQTAADVRMAYLDQIHAYLQSPKLARQMNLFWQDTMKLDGTAPAFVAQLVIDDRSFLEAFTAPGNVLEDAQMNAKFFSNFGFRRVRWLQEVFECSAFPAELSQQPIDLGGATPYTGTFPFDSIAGFDSGGRVNFRDTKSVLCANCHSNLNHIAPLFAHYDQDGQYQTDIVVPTPLAGTPTPIALMSDYLPQGEPLAWRKGVVISDMHTLGVAVANDPETSRCAVARLWNWAMGKTDIVDGKQKVPTDTIADQVTAFSSDGYRVKNALYRIFTSDDFVRF